jgi:hypothetical protein
VVVGVGGSGFALLWWTLETWFVLDRSTAVTIAIAGASLVTTPFIWWASQQMPSPRAHGSVGPASTSDGVAPPPTRAGTSGALATGLVVVLVLICGVAAVQTYGLMLGGDPGGSIDGQRGAEPGAQLQTVEVNKVAWFAGYRFEFGTATYDRDQSPPLTVAAVAENLGSRNVTIDVDVTFAIGGQHTVGFLRRSPVIPGHQQADIVLEFAVEPFDASLADGVLTFGDAEVAQTVVPIGERDGLITIQPRQVLGPTTVVHRDLTFEFTACELTGDVTPEHVQAPAGHVVLACHANARYDGQTTFHRLDEDQYRLREPSGNAVGPAEYPIVNLYSGVAETDTYVAFFIRAPASGTYALQIVDVHTSESETPATVKDVPITL